MVPLRPLQGQKTGHQKIANLEITTDIGKSADVFFQPAININTISFFIPIDYPFETFQLCQQQMGQIAKGRQFSV